MNFKDFTVRVITVLYSFIVKELAVVVSASTMFSVSDPSSGKWRHQSLIPLSGAYGDHSRRQPGPATDTFSAARVVPTHLGLKDKTARGIGGGGREPNIHGPPAPDHIDIINSSCITLDERYRNTYN